ncbi:RsmE family RNA methyltransferase [Rickettsiales bacterium LUAb2]
MKEIKTRIYYFNTLNTINQEVILSSEDSHYLVNVLRLKNNDQIALFNSIDGEWLAKVNNINKNSSKVILLEKIKEANINNTSIHLMYAPLKNTASSFLLEKITELGVTDITQVITTRTTNKPIDIKKIELKIKQAVEQCGRLSVPKVYASKSLKQLLFSLEATDSKLIWLNEQQTGEDLLTAISNNTQPINILIGPEGGFSAEEIDMLKHHPKVTPSYLKGNILKAETAAIISVAMSVYLKTNN